MRFLKLKLTALILIVCFAQAGMARANPDLTLETIDSRNKIDEIWNHELHYFTHQEMAVLEIPDRSCVTKSEELQKHTGGNILSEWRLKLEQLLGPDF